ncbi:hypothetical protein [Rhodococcus kronopolitis]|uniref:Secreted protein n=1 Tax=Rhodococcus kronopolitis TaxID=1460226 RepID=A0ABV9G0Q0_9NOCA
MRDTAISWTLGLLTAGAVVSAGLGSDPTDWGQTHQNVLPSLLAADPGMARDADSDRNDDRRHEERERLQDEHSEDLQERREGIPPLLLWPPPVTEPEPEPAPGLGSS